jgi:hypothetical protein
MVYRKTAGGVETVCGRESRYDYFTEPQSAAADATAAQALFAQRITDYRTANPINRILDGPRLTSRGEWMVKIARPGPTSGFPKGGQRIEDNNDSKETAFREFQEEIGVDLRAFQARTELYIVSIGGVTHNIYFLDLTGNDAAVTASINTGLPHSDLFDVKWIDINQLPAKLNQPSKDAVAELKRKLVPVPIMLSKPVASRPAENEKEAREYLAKKLAETGERRYSMMLDSVGKNWKSVQIYDGGRRTRRTGRSKLGTKKRHTGGRGRKTRRSP